MKVLIVERETLVAEMIRSRLEAMGHNVVIEGSKDEAIDLLHDEGFDVVFIDPSPLTEARQTIFRFRKRSADYTYMVLLGEDVNMDDAIKSGANDALARPVDPKALEQKIGNAAQMMKLVRRMGDESEDFPSAGGVIAKSAFNQLFLSALERADRYGEQSYVLFISVNNYDEILARDGAYAADYAVAKLSQYLVRLRRQSDIIGQTAKYEYALLLQRPIYETEPVEAANRFAQAIGECSDIVSSGNTPVNVKVSLSNVPIGSVVAHHGIQL